MTNARGHAGQACRNVVRRDPTAQRPIDGGLPDHSGHPAFIVLVVPLSWPVFFVLVIGWFGALFTGRLPEFAHTFLSGLIRWEIRVNVYMFLLTDQYPPFSLEDVEYPVRTFLPGRGPLNRSPSSSASFSAIPASVFSQIVIKTG